MRSMNDIERKFYDAFLEYYNIDSFNDEKIEEETAFSLLKTQYPIGIAIVDFYIEYALPEGEMKFAVEIDGHEYHKSKEQRYHDYVRERKLQAKGITIVRFTASEVFVNAKGCVEDLDTIIEKLAGDECQVQEYIWKKGLKAGVR